MTIELKSSPNRNGSFKTRKIVQMANADASYRDSGAYKLARRKVR